jgi:transcriptional regulator with GAF, ATPase, and Fis domain
LKAWIHSHDSSNSKFRLGLTQALIGRGVKIHEYDPAMPVGPGIILYEEEDMSNLCRFLIEISQCGLERVLVVKTSPRSSSSDNIWQLLRAGAADVLFCKNLPELAEEITYRLEHWENIDEVVQAPLRCDNLIGQCAAWISVLRQVADVAKFTDASILLVGETGTGKELLARWVHDLDPRPLKKRWAILDCTTIVPSLSGSEFFGHEKGAFTSAVSSREGAFALADGGTLFLDEIAELPLDLQAQLLRVIQEGLYKRVGGNTWYRTQFRLVCASNRDVLEEVKKGRFRSDLYYRIATFTFRLPCLRERVVDILPLARHFMKQIRNDGEALEMDEHVREYLHKRDYPGNVRELKQLVTRMIYRHIGSGPVTAGDIPEEERPAIDHDALSWCDAELEKALRRAVHQGVGLKEIKRKVAETAVRIGMTDEQNDIRQVALKLGVSRRALEIRRRISAASKEPERRRD